MSGVAAAAATGRDAEQGEARGEEAEEAGWVGEPSRARECPVGSRSLKM